MAFDNNYSIKITMKPDEANLQRTLKDIETRFKVKFDAKIDSGQIIKDFKAIQLENDKVVKAVAQYEDGMRKVVSQTFELNKATGQLEATTKKVSDNTQTLAKEAINARQKEINYIIKQKTETEKLAIANAEAYQKQFAEKYNINQPVDKNFSYRKEGTYENTYEKLMTQQDKFHQKEINYITKERTEEEKLYQERQKTFQEQINKNLKINQPSDYRSTPESFLAAEEKQAEQMYLMQEQSITKIKKENAQEELKQNAEINKGIELGYKERENLAKINHENEIRRITEERTAQEQLLKTNAEKYQNVLNNRLGIGTPINSAKESASTYKDLFQNAEKSTKGLSDVEKQIVRLNPAIKEGSSGLVAYGENLVMVGKKFADWLIIGTVFMQTIHGIQDMIKFTNDLNKSMTNIAMITGKSRDEINGMTQDYVALASSLHDTTSSVMQASEEFLRAGHNQKETTELIKASTIMSKIAGQDQKQTADQLIAITNGYKLNIQDTMSVVDKLTTVDNKSATSTSELATALERTSSSAQMAGVGFDKLVSWIATVSSVSRKSASSIGESFKSIFARLEDVKMGKTFDAEGESLNNVETSLNKVKIALRSDAVTFRDMGDVVDDLSKKWNGLSKVQQSEIAKNIAGVRQRENFLILMNNYSKSLQLEKDQLNSAGSAEKRYGEYAKSTEAKINDLTNAMQKLYMNTINSKFVNGVLELTTSFVKLGNGIGVLNIALTALGGFIAGKFLLEIPVLTNAMVELASAMGLATGTAATLGAALSASLVIGGVLLAVAAFNKLYVSVEEQKQKVTELTKEYESLQAEIEKFKNIKNPNAEQIQYLGLLERELQLKKEILNTEKEKLARKDVLGEGTFGNGIKGSVDEQIAQLNAIKESKKAVEEEMKRNPKGEIFGVSYVEALKNITNEANKVELSLTESKKTIEDYSNQLGTKTPKEFKNISNAINQAIPEVQKINGAFKNNTKAQDTNTKSKKDNADATQQQDNADAQFIATLQNTSDKVKFLNSTLQELNDNHQLSGETVSKIISEYPELIKYIGNEAQLRDKIKAKVAEETNAYKKALQEKIFSSEGFINNVLNGNVKLKNQLVNVYGADANNFKTYADYKSKVNGLLIDVIGKQWSQFYSSEANALSAVAAGIVSIPSTRPGGGIAFPSKQEQGQAQALLNLSNAMSKAASSATKNISIGGISSGSKKSGGSSSAASSISETLIEKDRYAQLNYQLEKTNGLIEANKALQENVDGKEKVNLLNQEIKLLQQKQNNLHAIAQEQRKERDELAKTLKGQGVKFSGTGDSLTALNAYTILQKKMDQVNAHRNDKDKSTYNALKAQYDNLAKEVSKFIEIQTKGIPEAGVSWQGLQKDINSTKNSINDVYQKQKDAYDSWVKDTTDTANQVIDVMKKAYEKQRDLEVAAIDQQISAEETRHQGVLDDLDSETKAYEDAVNSRMTEIDKQASTDDYNKQLSDAQKNRQDLVNKISILSLDNSFEAQAQVKDLNDQLAKQDDDIAKMKTDRDRTVRKDSLQEQLDLYKKQMDAKKKLEDDSYKATKQRLDDEKKATEYHYNELIADERHWTEVRSQILSGHLDDVKSQLNGFLDNFHNANQDVVTQMGQSWQELLNIINTVNEASGNVDNIKQAPQKVHAYGMSDTDYNNFIANGHAWETAQKTNNQKEMDRLSATNDSLRNKYNIPDGEYPSFASGGYTGDFGKSGKLAVLHEKELILNKDDTKNMLDIVSIVRNIVPNIKSAMPSIPLLPSLNMAGGNSSSNDVVYNLNLNIANLTGDRAGADFLFSTIKKEIHKLGGRF